MTQTTQAFVAAYITCLTSDDAMETLLHKLLRGGDKLPNATIALLADAHASFYGAFIAQSKSGSYQFFKSEKVASANRHAAATMKWNRGINRFHDVQRKAASRSKTEAEVKLANTYAKLTAAQKRHFLKLIGF